VESKVTIYRIQNKDGYGPYRGPHCTDEWSDRPNIHRRDLDNKHPPPFNETWKNLILDWESNIKDLFFGFKDIKQLKNWFNEKELDNLKDLGYDIIKLELHEQQVWYGQHQVAFERWPKGVRL